MTLTQPIYPDIELALLEYLEQACPRTVTQVMYTDDDHLPVIRVQRIGGGELPSGNDQPRVSIQCFAKPTADAPRASQDLSSQVAVLMDSIDGVVVGVTCMDEASKDSGPVSRPWDDPDIRVTELIYRVTVRT